MDKEVIEAIARIKPLIDSHYWAGDVEDIDALKLLIKHAEKQPTNFVGLDNERLEDYIDLKLAQLLVPNNPDQLNITLSMSLAKAICSRFGQRTVELPSVEEIYEIINQNVMAKINQEGDNVVAGKGDAAKAIHAAMQAKLSRSGIKEGEG